MWDQRRIRKVSGKPDGIQHNCGGGGKPYFKPTSIPQGDPLSMMMTSLLLRPWIMQMHALAVQPRLLADDLQILSIGPNHLKNFEMAFSKTQEHLGDMGEEPSND